MAGRPQLAPYADTARELESLLALPDHVIRDRLLALVRESGIVFRSQRTFERLGWQGEPAPRFARFWRVEGGVVVPSTDPILWNLRESLLRDDALLYASILLHRRLNRYSAQWVGGMETAAIPLVAGLLAVNRACGYPLLNGFYIRKARKKNGLRRLLEGPMPARGTDVVLVDDILNKGISKARLVDYCAQNALNPRALLVLVDTKRKGTDLFSPVCPVDAIFTRSDVLGDR